MPYAQRENGAIVGVFANRQKGYADEFLPDDAPEVVAFLGPKAADTVSSRQFKLQLLAAGLLDQVGAWVAQQPRDIQIAYEYSGAFVRSSPMMMEGFAIMGFTAKQIDDFFAAASKL